MAELVGRDFSQSFESGDFGVGTQLLDGSHALFFRIAVDGFVHPFLAVTHAEQGGLQDVHMTFLYQVGEELEEEGNHQQTDVHTVHIGIGGHDYLIISESVEPFFNVQGSLQEVELFVLVDHLLGESERIQRLTAQAEHGLRIDIAAFRDGTAGGVSLGDEDGTFQAGVVFFFLSAFLIVQVDAAVTQLTVVQVSFLGTLTGYLRDAGNGLAFFFGFLDFLQQDFGHIGMLVEVVVYLLFYEIAHKLVDADARQRIGVAFGIFLRCHGQ